MFCVSVVKFSRYWTSKKQIRSSKQLRTLTSNFSVFQDNNNKQTLTGKNSFEQSFYLESQVGKVDIFLELILSDLKFFFFPRVPMLCSLQLGTLKKWVKS
jgi:hypothetical protein